MTWIFNDLSIERFFADRDELLSSFEPLLKIVYKGGAHYDSAVLCPRMLACVNYSNDVPILKTLNKSGGPLATLFLSWAAKDGPFAESDSDTDIEEVLFKDDSVRDRGLGLCVQRRSLSDALSCQENKDFHIDPIDISLLRNSGLVENVQLKNLYDYDLLLRELEELSPPPENWEHMLTLFKEKFSSLLFSTEIIEQLRPYPFSIATSNAIEQLLKILNEYMDSREDGLKTKRSNEILRDHFSGGGRFSDESTTNKRKFKDQMTFRDPENPDSKIFCSWHGKVAHRAYRLHFGWPVPRDQTHLKVVYMGPHITE